VDGARATPVAWQLTTARRKAVDRLRRDTAYAARLAIMQVEAQRLRSFPQIWRCSETLSG
jgi:RNA polymerase sigma-70 factor, ECF subfamily